MLVTIASAPIRLERIMDQLQQRMVDGALFYGIAGVEQQRLESIARSGVAIAVHHRHLEPNGFDVIRRNDAEIPQIVLDYLLSKGHRRIGVVGPSIEGINRGREFLQKRGLPVDDRDFQLLPTMREAAYHYLKERAPHGNLPTAYYATADVNAIGLLVAAQQLGIRVPDDMSIIGTGNLPETTITDPQITTVGTETLDYHREAQMLFDRILSDEKFPGRVLRRERVLILRGSA